MTTDPITGQPIDPRGYLPAGSIPAFVSLKQYQQALAELRLATDERNALRAQLQRMAVEVERWRTVGRAAREGQKA